MRLAQQDPVLLARNRRSRRGLRRLSLLLFLACAWGGWAEAGSRIQDDLFSVSFPTASQGWAVGRWGTVLHTADGGTTWEKQKTGVDDTLASVSFVDAQNGWAVGDRGTILHTANGGKTWEKQKSPVPYFLMGVHFVSPTEGWVVTERTTILHTADAGRTWTVQFQDQDFILKSVSFADARTGWAVGEYGFIYRTSDGGKTWVHQAGEFRISEETGEVVGGAYLFDVAAVDERTAWVVGIDGHVAKTTDGGKTWQAAARGVPKTHLFGVRAASQGVVIAGDATLLASADGGATWRPLAAEPTIRYGWLYGLAKRGQEGLVAVGQGGWIYVSDAKASSWKLASR